MKAKSTRFPLPVAAVCDFLKHPLLDPHQTLYVALSGGMDSVVLLRSVLMSGFEKERIIVLHLNHNLQKESVLWQRFCEAHCQQQGLRYVTQTLIQKPAKGDSIEAFAREARYDFFKKQLKQGACVLTAHHLDDQVETFFVNLLRGTGIEGLAGMSACTPFGEGFLGRPFLALSREQLAVFAKAAHLDWCEDQSNQDTRFVRNFLRIECLPHLSKRFPAYRKTIARTMSHCAEAEAIVNHCLVADFEKMYEGDKLSIHHLSALSAPLQNWVLKQWIKKTTGKMVSSALIREIHKAIHARIDRKPCIHFSGLFSLNREKENLMIRRERYHDTDPT